MLTVAAVVGGVLLRSEGLLFAGALAVALAVARFKQQGPAGGPSALPAPSWRSLPPSPLWPTRRG